MIPVEYNRFYCRIASGVHHLISTMTHSAQFRPAPKIGLVIHSIGVFSRKLNRLVLEGGFPHHLAKAMDNVCEDVRMLCTFLGVEYVSPHD